jgi:hypothetical protein
MQVETLEVRQMLSAPVDVTQLIDSKLWQVAQDTQLHLHNDLLNAGVAKLDTAGRIETYVRVSDGLNPATLTQQLTQMGARVTEVNDAMGALDVWLPADKIDDAARIPGVIATQLPDYPVTNVVTSAGDGILKADKVRNQFLGQGIDGTGIKIGVISDGVNHRANIVADLPSVTVDPSHAGSGDEGTAMLEIVHDLAPGAQLYFSGPANSLQMPACITYLQNQGCNVIVDDLSFFGEGYFTDTSIANAAQAAVNSGVVYVTSAGNYSDQQHYQSTFIQSASATADGRLHRFNLSPLADADDVNIPAGSTFRAFMEWSDPWGGSSNNYNLYLYNSDTFAQLAAGASVQDGQAGDLPFESVLYTNNTGSTVHAQIWVEKKNTAATREFEFFTIGNSSMVYDTPSDALVGQEAIPGVMSVAAAQAGSPTSVTNYSSRGGSTIYSNFTTQTSSPRQTLDGTAIDGVQTAVGQAGFFVNPFYGTSAAAPHAAAIAALIKQVNPSLTPAQILQIMADTATDIGAVGYDTTAGAGLYNALDAVYKAYTPTAPDLTAASDLGPINSDNLTNDNTPTFTGTVPAGSFVRLFVDGVQQTSIQLGAGNTTYNLTSGALGQGTHNVTIRVASSSTVALTHNSNSSAALQISIDLLPPVLNGSNFNYFGPAPQNLTFTFTEAVNLTVQNTDLVLNNTTIPATIPAANTASSTPLNTTAVFTFPGYAAGALPDGKYTATIAAANITDLAGNPLPTNVSYDFFFLNGDANHDGAVDVADLGILATNWQLSPKNFPAGDFNYDGTVDVSDLGILATNWQKTLPVPSPALEKSGLVTQASTTAHRHQSTFADDPALIAELA